MSFLDEQRQEFAAMMAEAIRMVTLQNMDEQTRQAKEAQVWTNKLRKYIGEDDFMDFWREVILYIVSHKRDFETNDAGIYFMLLFMKGGQTLTWAQNYIEKWL